MGVQDADLTQCSIWSGGIWSLHHLQVVFGRYRWNFQGVSICQTRIYQPETEQIFINSVVEKLAHIRILKKLCPCIICFCSSSLIKRVTLPLVGTPCPWNPLTSLHHSHQLQNITVKALLKLLKSPLIFSLYLPILKIHFIFIKLSASKILTNSDLWLLRN